MAKLQKEVDRLEGNYLFDNNFRYIYIYLFVFFSRRITCRKGEIQGRKRRTRHDIKRIIGLLKKKNFSISFLFGGEQQQASFLLFFISFFISFCLLNPYHLFLCEFVCAEQWHQNKNLLLILLHFTTETKQSFYFYFFLF